MNISDKRREIYRLAWLLLFCLMQLALAYQPPAKLSYIRKSSLVSFSVSLSRIIYYVFENFDRVRWQIYTGQVG